MFAYALYLLSTQNSYNSESLDSISSLKSHHPRSFTRDKSADFPHQNPLCLVLSNKTLPRHPLQLHVVKLSPKKLHACPVDTCPSLLFGPDLANPFLPASLLVAAITGLRAWV
ncbi:hypothetical protein ACLB2K_061311 [Fragaria x ananassa]